MDTSEMNLALPIPIQFCLCVSYILYIFVIFVLVKFYFKNFWGENKTGNNRNFKFLPSVYQCHPFWNKSFEKSNFSYDTKLNHEALDMDDSNSGKLMTTVLTILENSMNKNKSDTLQHQIFMGTSKYQETIEEHVSRVFLDMTTKKVRSLDFSNTHQTKYFDEQNTENIAVVDSIDEPKEPTEMFNNVGIPNKTINLINNDCMSNEITELVDKDVNSNGSTDLVDNDARRNETTELVNHGYERSNNGTSLVILVHESVETVKATMRSESLLPEYQHHGGVSSWKVGGASKELYGPEGSFTLANSTAAVGHVTEVFLGNVSVAL